MEQGGGGERQVVFLAQVGHLRGGHTKAVGVLCQGSSSLGWGVGKHPIPTQNQLGAQGARIQ